MALAKAAQLLFLFWIVIFTVSFVPVRSEVISFITSVPGVLVGKGPAVSVAVVVHEPAVPLVVPVVVSVVVSVVVVGSTLSLLHDPKIGRIAADPNADKNPLLKNSLRSIVQ